MTFYQCGARVCKYIAHLDFVSPKVIAAGTQGTMLSVLIATGRISQQALTSACPVSMALARDCTLKHTFTRRSIYLPSTYGAIQLRRQPAATDEARIGHVPRWRSWQFKKNQLILWRGHQRFQSFAHMS